MCKTYIFLQYSQYFPSSIQTNDSKVVGAVRMEHLMLVVGPSVTHNNSQQLHTWMKYRFHGNLTAVEVKGEVGQILSPDINQRTHR